MGAPTHAPGAANGERVTVATKIVRFLEAQGVKYVFGLCGHTNLAMLEALRNSSIEFVSVRHEQVAAHTADGYARATGRLGVVLTHGGPGLTNATTGIANAALDSIPVLMIAGDIPSYTFGRHAHQEILYHADASQYEIYRPFVKRAFRVERPEGIGDILRRAYITAMSGRRGPVLLDVAMDVFSRYVPGETFAPIRIPAAAGLSADVAKEIAEVLARAERPLLWLGGGVVTAGAGDCARQLAERLGIPIVYSLMGKGAVSDRHPQVLGMCGFWGTPPANRALREADVMLAIGTRFAETDSSSWDPRIGLDVTRTRLIHIDIDPAEIGRSYPAAIGAVADAAQALADLLSALPDGLETGGTRAEWLKSLLADKEAWEQEVAPPRRSDAVPLRPERILHDLRTVLPEDGYLVTDVGWNKNGVGQQFPIYVPRTHIACGGFSTMGFGPSGALGVKMANPDKVVVALVGDGAFTSQPSVLATAVEYNVPVVWLVMNNYAFGTINGLQTSHYPAEYGTSFRKNGEPYNPDLVALAKSYGAEGVRIERAEDLVPALQQAFAANRPVVLDVPMTLDPVPTPGHWDINDIYGGLEPGQVPVWAMGATPR